MSSALVRQALEFVDQDQSDTRKRNKRRTASIKNPERAVQGLSHPYQVKNKKNKIADKVDSGIKANIKKLLALSTPVADGIITDKIVERAVKGKPLIEKIKVDKEEEKSILFPEESFEEFEKGNFCS